MSEHKAAVVILNWNGEGLLRRFLPDVVKHSKDDAKVYVADNASGDGSLAYIEETFGGEVEIIRLPENHGYAKGYNLALEHVGEQYCVLLNSDVQTSPGWLEPLLAGMDADPGLAACQPKILDFNKRHCFEYAGAAGGMMDTMGYPFCRGRIFDNCEQDYGQYDEPARVFWASGAALCIRTDIYRKIGGLDNDFFAHMEEIDLCWRLKRAGHGIGCFPKSVVYHVGGGSLQYGNPHKTYLNFRNNLQMLLKNLPAPSLWKIFLRLNLDGLALLKSLAGGDTAGAAAIIKAHLAFYAGLPKWWRKRKASQHRVAGTGLAGGNTMDEGRYNGSIVFDYFFRKRTRFAQLPKKSTNIGR